jgi:adenosylhomocysteine nucleosidase
MIVILTALQLEYLAIRRHLVDIHTHEHRAGTLFEKGVIAGRHVAIAVIGEGNTSAATLTERAITEFQPTTVLFVGIAGSLRDWLVPGDVVVATRIYAFHGGRSTDHVFRTRPRVWDSSHRLEQLARSVARSNTWQSAIPTAPAVHFNPIAAGEVLLDSRKSALARRLRDRYEDAVAIEMESAGMAYASQLNEKVPSLTIRGISDLADGTKDQTGDPELAAENAAAFAVAFIARLTENARNNRGHRPATSVNVTNNASGNARVSGQFGVVNDVRQFNAQPDPPSVPDPPSTSDPSSTSDPLSVPDRLRRAIFADRDAGQLGHDAAEEAMRCLDQSGTTPGGPLARRNIRRLHELLGHRPQLARLVRQLTPGGP